VTERLVAFTDEQVVEDFVALREQLGDVVDRAVGPDAAGPVCEGEISDDTYSYAAAREARGRG
jgi:hypothetical protein